MKASHGTGQEWSTALPSLAALQGIVSGEAIGTRVGYRNCPTWQDMALQTYGPCKRASLGPRDDASALRPIAGILSSSRQNTEE